jgi:hypothetical protein
VLGIHAQLPETRVEASINTTKYARNSNSIGPVFRRLDEIGAGEARRETGSPTSSINTGTTSSRDDSDNWTRNANVNREADIFPVIVMKNFVSHVGCKR